MAYPILVFLFGDLVWTELELEHVPHSSEVIDLLSTHCSDQVMLPSLHLSTVPYPPGRVVWILYQTGKLRFFLFFYWVAFLIYVVLDLLVPYM